MSEPQHGSVPNFDQVKKLVLTSLHQLMIRDCALLEIDASERAITHKLAEYIQSQLPYRNVDCEYNRNVTEGERAAKRIHILEAETEKEIQKAADKGLRLSYSTYPSAYPDIIVHKRKVNSDNLLVIEVKKKNNPLGNDFDFKKLAAFTVNEEFKENEKPNRYNYSFGVFILLDTGHHDLAEPELTWFINGSQIG